jgi:hypothetical protein
MRLLKAVFGLGLCTGLIVWSTPATPMEVVTELIRCPETASLVLNWKNKIGEKPTFEAASAGDYSKAAVFSEKKWSNQGFSCRYTLPDSKLYMLYNHRFSRTVTGCKDKDPRTWECTIEKK